MAATNYKGANSWASYISSLASGDLLTAALLYTTGIRNLVDRTRWAGHRLRKLYQEAITFTADASLDTCSAADHLLLDGTTVLLTTTGTLPAGLSGATTYFIISADSDAGTFQLSLTVGGAAINITDAGTGAHAVTVVPVEAAVTVLSDASQTIAMPPSKVYLCTTPTAARNLTPYDAGGAAGHRMRIIRPNTGGFAINIVRVTSGDSIAVLPSGTHCSVDLEWISTKYRVAGLSVGATVGVDS